MEAITRSVPVIFLRNMLLATFVLAAVGASLPAQTSTPSAAAYESDPKFVAALADAKSLYKKHEFDYSRDAYTKANKIAGGNCIPCLEQLAEINAGMHNWKDAIADAKHLLDLATSPFDKSIAEGHLGSILVKQAGEKPKPAQLEAAHAALQAAISDYPKNLSARWSDGCVLARMGKLDDAKEQFTACAASASPKDPMRARAALFAEDPSLSLHKMAPAFEVTALDGARFNLDSMTGRVVLIDFWATWCGPCNEELPTMKKIAKEFANEPLTIISISWDADEAKWKDFISKHEMTWVQYRDADHKLSGRFNVAAIPHYFTIDSDGVLTAEILGSGNDVEGKLRKLIKRAKESKLVVNQVAQTAGAQARE